jgi:hypothetical protein
MIRILAGLDQLEDSDRDVQVAISASQITVVTALDEFYIDDLNDAYALRDAIDKWIARKTETAS